jgi:hypothetical protein
MEFYRDIFKVMLARDNGMPNLKRFVFLTPETSAASLRKGMGGAVIRDSVVGLRLKIDVIGLGRIDGVPTAEELRLAKIVDLEKKIDRLQTHLKHRLHCVPGVADNGLAEAEVSSP